jgi:hypothetical protein
MATSSKATKSRSSSSKRSSNSSGSSAANRSSSARARKSTSASDGRGPGRRVVELAGKAKVPLIAGGAVVAGAVAGVAARSRVANRSHGPMATVRRATSKIPRPNLDARNIDLETVKSAGERVRTLGQQTVDIAGALEKSNRKHK